MRIATYNDARIGVVGKDDTIVDIGDLLQQYDPLGPEDLLPDLITHFEDLQSELESRAAAGSGTPLSQVRLPLPDRRRSSA
jgi:uncharacterized UBP type Zn finger protein